MTEWNECPAHVREFIDGKEIVIICDLPLHCPPDDASEMHWDSRLGIYWRSADGADYSEES